jgi:hypothetical protein
MSAPWPGRRSAMLGMRVRMAKSLANHDGPIAVGTMGQIAATRSLWSFTVDIDPCRCCGMRRRVTYVDRADVELLA